MPEQETKKKTSGWMVLMKIMVMLVLIAYLVFSFIKEHTWKNHAPCQDLIICVKDKSQASFVSEEDLLAILEKKHLNPKGSPINQINLQSIEKEIKTHQFVLDAQCYKTANNVVHVDVEQRLPVMRIMSSTGENYFIDGNGDKMLNVEYPADVVVATGSISQKYAKKYLAHIGKTLQENSFWNSQVEQVNVLKDGTLEMIPRVGNHVINLGKPTGIAEKLKRVKVFYDKVLCNVGWNKYSRISVEYNNQIICTKTK